MRSTVKVGDKYNMLTVLCLVGKVGRKYLWECMCECGTLCERLTNDLTSTKRPRISCGCMQGAVKHRLSRHPIHNAWRAMRYRCQKKDHPYYRYYGGRGISVCDRWLTFENFASDMLPTWKKGLTLERIDNSKGYDPTNCRWASRSDQMRNTRRNVFVDTPEGKLCAKDAAVLLGLGRNTIYERVSKGITGLDLTSKGKVCRSKKQ